MFATEWIFTLFSSIIPIEEMDTFFEEFFENSWIFFYKFVIHILRKHEEAMLGADNITDMIIPIKESKQGFKFLNDIPLFKMLFSQNKWIELIEGSKKEKMNETYIKNLYESYDIDNLRFKYKII